MASAPKDVDSKGVAQRSAADKVAGALNGFKQSCSAFSEKVASGALLTEISLMVPPIGPGRATGTRVLPKESVAASANGIVAKVSQNERWNLFLGWGATYPGHLLVTDKGAWTTENLKTLVPTDAKLPPEKPTKKLWAPPLGFEYAPGGKWALVQNRNAASDTHDENQCERADTRENNKTRSQPA